LTPAAYNEHGGTEVSKANPKANRALYGSLYLDSGEYMGKISHEYTNNEDGFQMEHKITFHEAAGPVIEGHGWHLAIEFRNWLLTCL